MDFVTIISTIASLFAIIGGVAAFVRFVSKNNNNKEAVTHILITTLIMTIILAGSIILTLVISHPTVATNQIGSFPPSNQTISGESSKTVTLATTQPTPTPDIKSISEARKLVCISLCDLTNGLTVVLKKIIINKTAGNMSWYFTITYNAPDNLSNCPEMDVPLFIEDPSGKTTQEGPPGTLTERTPINDGQTLEAYTTIPLIPQTGITYSLHAQPECHVGDNAGEGNIYQIETFTF